MKKKNFLISALAIICIAFAFIGCKPKEEKKSLNFDELIQADFKTAQDTFGQPVFYEAQVLFDKNITEEGNLSVIKVVTVIQDIDSLASEPTCIMTTHILNGDVEETDVEYVHDYWMEDCTIDLNTIKIKLNDAIDILKSSEITLPESNTMIFRRPLGPELLEYPFYIFGQMKTGFVSVDAGTGEVSELF